jgi:hypothetical protein
MRPVTNGIATAIVLVAIFVAVSQLITASVTVATPGFHVAIYVGPQVRDGFVDVDRGVLDSIKDRVPLHTGRC